MNRRPELWVVVEVQSGIPVGVNAYLNKRSAVRREQALRKRMRPDYDEVGIFNVRIGQPRRASGTVEKSGR